MPIKRQTVIAHEGNKNITGSWIKSHLCYILAILLGFISYSILREATFISNELLYDVFDKRNFKVA